MRSTRQSWVEELDGADAPAGRRPAASDYPPASTDDDARSLRRKALIDAFFDGIEDSFAIDRDAA